jgi:hypothetical protein
MTERAIQNEILLAASAGGYTLFRNNVGLGWQGTVSDLPAGTLIQLPGGKRFWLDGRCKLIANPRPLNAGLCEGSSDLIGWVTVMVGPDLIGRSLAQFVGIEVKTPKGRESKPQATFRRVVTEAGGLALVARGPGDVPGVE